MKASSIARAALAVTLAILVSQEMSCNRLMADRDRPRRNSSSCSVISRSFFGLLAGVPNQHFEGKHDCGLLAAGVGMADPGFGIQERNIVVLEILELLQAIDTTRHFHGDFL